MTPRHLWFGIYILVVLAAQTWPVYTWLGNRIEPFVLGVPFSLAWVVGWVLLTFVVLAIYNAVDERTEDAGRHG